MVGTKSIDEYLRTLRKGHSAALPQKFYIGFETNEEQVRETLAHYHSLFRQNCTGLVHHLGGGRLERHDNTIPTINFVIRRPYSTWTLSPTGDSVRAGLGADKAYRFAIIDLLNQAPRISGGVLVVNDDLLPWECVKPVAKPAGERYALTPQVQSQI